MEEEDLLPPGTEESTGKLPKPAAASNIDIPAAAASTTETHPKISEVPRPAPPEPVISAPPPSGPIRPPPPVGAPTGPPVPQFFPPPPPGLALGGRMRFPPPPMPLPPMRPGFNMPPGRPPSFGGHGHGGPHGPRFRPSNRPSPVFSSAPQIIKSDSKIVSETMIQAKPQIRSLSADVTRFVPSIVKQKKDDVDRPKRHG